MIVALFLLLGIATAAACQGRRGLAIGLFVVSFLGAVLWLNHHMTTPLSLSF